MLGKNDNMKINDRKDQVVPILIIAGVGGATLATMAAMLGGGILCKWYFYPSLASWIFSLRCLMTGISGSWDRAAWKICQWWSGIWSVAFLLFFCAPPFSSMMVGSLFAPIAINGGINPFLAALAHIMIWACVTDILKNSAPKQK